jgi:hypothetical protein
MIERARAIRHLGQSSEAIAEQPFGYSHDGVRPMGRIDDALSLPSEGLASALQDRQGRMAPRWEVWRARFLLMTGQISDAAAALEGVFADDDMARPVTIPDTAGALALGRTAIHTGDERLSLRCAEIARATLRVDQTDARHQPTRLLALQAKARGEPTLARAELGDGAHVGRLGARGPRPPASRQGGRRPSARRGARDLRGVGAAWDSSRVRGRLARSGSGADS